jgi:cell division protein FtsB
MYRRRRTFNGEVHFSFDSFLDLVANVIGIIIRLILVAWVGARTYQGVVEFTPEEEARIAQDSKLKLQSSNTSLEQQIAKTKDVLEQARASLYEKLKLLDKVEEVKGAVDRDWSKLSAEAKELDRERGTLDRTVAVKEKAVSAPEYTMSELRERTRMVLKQIDEVKKLPVVKKTLRYHTPVSRPVHTDELMFECHYGRVTFIDLPAFIAEIQRGLEDVGDRLRDQWEIVQTAGPIGAFRMRYTIARGRDALDTVIKDGRPGSRGFRYGLTGWVVEPVRVIRGEPLEKALSPGSEFRQIVDGGVPEQTVVTFWVYPDSFPLFRQLRDFLYERGLEVAGRPLPEEASIAASQNGTRSRGQ